MTKYKEYFQRMVDANKKLFEDFRIIHDKYAFEGESLQDKFNQEGKKILLIIKEWEGKLCHTQEKTYSQYAGGLSEKFWGEIRKEFPKIDYIGIKIKTFSLKKISLK